LPAPFLAACEGCHRGAGDPGKLWRWYIQLTEVEDAFRISKSDLGLRPIYHQRQDRVEAHILVCFIALAMWRSLEMWLRVKGLGDTARQVIKEMTTLHSLDVVLPLRDNTPSDYDWSHVQSRSRLTCSPNSTCVCQLDRKSSQM